MSLSGISTCYAQSSPIFLLLPMRFTHHSHHFIFGAACRSADKGWHTLAFLRCYSISPRWIYPPYRISILLTFSGYLPGVIHAWYVIYKHREPTQDERLAAAARNQAHQWESEVRKAEARTMPSDNSLPYQSAKSAKSY
ncbi:hypothetical protein BC936DRAFT_147760 [Jimgerdemannia flammicorona]|uniref:Uncharacterized protein n=1 Tax=Jimgerdemannia flammicorona TaxID=994334 RepID=A0A433D4K7_9FUNG|nr:hypothetical protein BC936DRAFT_147760 [Jimgerdemannia flammicorona]